MATEIKCDELVKDHSKVQHIRFTLESADGSKDIYMTGEAERCLNCVLDFAKIATIYFPQIQDHSRLTPSINPGYRPATAEAAPTLDVPPMPVAPPPEPVGAQHAAPLPPPPLELIAPPPEPIAETPRKKRRLKAVESAGGN